MTATRRLAAILAADIVGYSRLMGLDEAGTAKAVHEHRIAADPLIADHGGRVVKTTGDGVLIEFASVIGAVECALALQHLAADRNAEVPTDRRMEWRMGVHLGDVLIEGDDILGDGVNIAARLEGIAEPNGICISEDAFRQVRGKVAVEFADIGEQSLKNIARPLRVYRVGSSPAAKRPVSPATALPLPDKPSIAVLPFSNMSGDPEQEFFADGIAEDVITALSRYPSLFVIARNSCFTYKGRAVDVKQVGRELGVRYALEGSLRKSGNRIRVTAQLVEAETGRHVWAERYDRDLADIFAVQDEITETVTIAIAPAIAEAERQRAMRKPPESLDAWAAYQRGLWNMAKATANDCALAEKFFQQAIDLDPGFADAYCGLALAQMQAAIQYQTRELKDALNSVELSARRAVALDANNAIAHARLSGALFLRCDRDGALAEAECALALSPNLDLAYWQRGLTLIWGGQPEAGVKDVQTSLRLEPRGSDLAHRLVHLAAGYYFSHSYDEAVGAAKQAIRSFPEFPNSYRWLAAALGQLGRMEEAKAALEKVLAIAPASFEMFVRRRVPWHRPEDHAHLLEGLRKAGWSE